MTSIPATNAPPTDPLPLRKPATLFRFSYPPRWVRSRRTRMELMHATGLHDLDPMFGVIRPHMRNAVCAETYSEEHFALSSEWRLGHYQSLPGVRARHSGEHEPQKKRRASSSRLPDGL